MGSHAQPADQPAGVTGAIMAGKVAAARAAILDNIRANGGGTYYSVKAAAVGVSDQAFGRAWRELNRTHLTYNGRYYVLRAPVDGCRFVGNS